MRFVLEITKQEIEVLRYKCAQAEGKTDLEVVEMNLALHGLGADEVRIVS